MKRIKLTQGKYAMVDDCDFEELSKHKWYAEKSGNTFYAARGVTVDVNQQKIIKMHRVILGLSSPDVLCDHIDGNGLNNTRANIRSCTRNQNQMNKRLSAKNTTGFKGVCLNKKTGKFYAQIKVGRKNKYLGYFDCPLKAAKAYNCAAKKLHGEFASPNIIKE